MARTDARYGIDVFWKAFLANKSGYRVGIPSVPLAELYEGCRDAIAAQGGEVRLRCGVRQIIVERNQFVAVLLEDGSRVSADACILAVPHDSVLALLPGDMSEPGAPLEGLRRIKTSPITGVHLWFDRPVMAEPFLTLLDHTTQWIFNKSKLSAKPETNGANARPMNRAIPATSRAANTCNLSISASYDLVPRSRQEIIDLCMRELC